MDDNSRKTTINNGIIMKGGTLKAKNISFSNHRCTKKAGLLSGFNDKTECFSNFPQAPLFESSDRTAILDPGITTAGGTTSPLRLFIIYSTVDSKLAHELLKHLQVLVMRDHVRVDPSVRPGDHVESIEGKQLAIADVVLLLLSADFFCEERCQKLLAQALTRKNDASIPIVPVRMRAVAWKNTELGMLNPTPPESVAPIVEQSDRDAAWKIVANEIQRLLPCGID